MFMWIWTILLHLHIIQKTLLSLIAALCALIMYMLYDKDLIEAGYFHHSLISTFKLTFLLF